MEETRGWEQEARQWAAFIALELLPSNDVASLLEVRICGSNVLKSFLPELCRRKKEARCTKLTILNLIRLG